MNQYPLISVLLPAYNSELYIREAIESILQQTYPHFELLIFDDYSTDNTVAKIETFNDARIKLVTNKKNIGLSRTLIMGIAAARGKYVARMDNDDISHLDRFEKQVKFLEANPEYGIVGSNLETIAANGKCQVWSYPGADEDIRLHTIIDSPFVHPAVMIRKEVLDKHHLNYNPSYEPCDDYKFWIDILKVTRGANLNEVLLLYRLHPNQTTSMKKDILIARSKLLRREIIENMFSYRLTNEELDIHYYYFNEIGNNTISLIQSKYKWRKKLLVLVGASEFKTKGTELVEKFWVTNLRTINEFKPSFIKFIWNNYFMKTFSIFETMKFVIKCMIGYKVSESRLKPKAIN